jgi:protein TonB
MVDVYVKPSGRPTKAKISQSSGFADLDEAAIESVLNWRFVPAMRGDDTVSDWTTVKIVYQLPVLAPPPAVPPAH